MTLRVTPQYLADNAIRYSLAHNQNLARLQRQISSGLRIEKPSDDPTSMTSLLARKASVERLEIDAVNIESVRSRLNQSVTQLLAAKEGFAHASRVALEGVQALPEQLDALAMEVEGILESLERIANATDGDKPLFAGTSNERQPFQIVARNERGEPQQITYQGTLDRASTVVDIGTTVDTFYSGFEVFGFASASREAAVFLGNTGAAPGSASTSARGRGTLVVRHTATTYSGASGLRPGTDSAARDTILGPHTLTVDGALSTLSLDGGPAVAFTPADTNIRITNNSGAVVYVDASSLVPGFNGDIVLEGQGTLSLDDGLSEIVLDFSTNQAVVDARTGQVTFVDSQRVSQAGSEPIEYPGTANAFQALIELRDELRNTRQLQPGQWQQAMQRRLADLDRIHDHLLSVVGEQSVNLENLDTLQSRAETYQLELKRNIAEVESVDIPQAAIELQAEQNALQFTYLVAMRLMDLSVLDFLR